MKYLLVGLNSKSEQTEKRIGKFEIKSIEIIESEVQKRNRKKEHEWPKKPVGNHQEYNTCIMGVLGKKRNKGRKKE